jgi:predicted Zn-dependent peptidase
MRAWIVTALLVCASSSATNGSDIRTWALDPTTEWVLLEDHRVPLVEVWIEFPVGKWSPWASDNAAEEAFEIQLYDPDNALRRRADALAVDLSLRMGSHSGSIVARCSRESVDDAVALIRDVLSNRDFDRGRLGRWSRQRRLEWKASLKNPLVRLRQAGARLLLARDDPRRRAWERPRKVSRDVRHLVAVRDAIVRMPGRTIAFAGDIDEAEALRLADDLLPPAAAEPPADIAPRLFPIDVVTGPELDHRLKLPRINQVYYGYGRTGLAYDDVRYPAFLVADHVLGGHFFSRLYKALRHEGGETYGATTFGGGGIAPGPYALTTFTRSDNAAHTEEKLREVLRVFREHGITEEERQAAVGYLRGNRAFSRQSPAQILSRWLWERRHDYAEGFWDDLVERAAAVPLEDVNAFIEDFYDPARFTMIQVVPPQSLEPPPRKRSSSSVKSTLKLVNDP